MYDMGIPRAGVSEREKNMYEKRRNGITVGRDDGNETPRSITVAREHQRKGRRKTPSRNRSPLLPPLPIPPQVL